MKSLIKILLGLTLLICYSVFAQDGKLKYKQEVGFYDFGDFSAVRSNENYKEVWLEKAMLDVTADMSKSDNPQFAEVLRKLELINYVKYEFSSSTMTFTDNKIKQISNDLEKKNWEKLIATINNENTSEIYIIRSDDKIAGLVTLSKKNKNASFINIVGDIDLANISKLSKSLNLSELTDVEENEPYVSKELPGISWKRLKRTKENFFRNSYTFQIYKNNKPSYHIDVFEQNYSSIEHMLIYRISAEQKDWKATATITVESIVRNPRNTFYFDNYTQVKNFYDPLANEFFTVYSFYDALNLALEQFLLNNK
ncbi:MAG: DUF4252 domain-containing protein [Ignavibacteriales bacterium]|nr:DUF4252 domain-containing protein [Ignavibacteriales bacterium]